MGANSEWNVKYQYSNILPLHAFDMRFSFDDVSKEIRLSQDLYVIQSIEGENHSHGTSRRRERRYEEEEEEEDEDYSEDEAKTEEQKDEAINYCKQWLTEKQQVAKIAELTEKNERLKKKGRKHKTE